MFTTAGLARDTRFRIVSARSGKSIGCGPGNSVQILPEEEISVSSLRVLTTRPPAPAFTGVTPLSGGALTPVRQPPCAAKAAAQAHASVLLPRPLMPPGYQTAKSGGNDRRVAVSVLPR